MNVMVEGDVKVQHIFAGRVSAIIILAILSHSTILSPWILYRSI